jgi:hypothetical protein
MSHGSSLAVETNNISFRNAADNVRHISNVNGRAIRQRFDWNRVWLFYGVRARIQSDQIFESAIFSVPRQSQVLRGNRVYDIERRHSITLQSLIVQSISRIFASLRMGKEQNAGHGNELRSNKVQS